MDDYGRFPRLTSRSCDRRRPGWPATDTAAVFTTGSVPIPYLGIIRRSGSAGHSSSAFVYQALLPSARSFKLIGPAGKGTPTAAGAPRSFRAPPFVPCSWRMRDVFDRQTKPHEEKKLNCNHNCPMYTWRWPRSVLGRIVKLAACGPLHSKRTTSRLAGQQWASDLCVAGQLSVPRTTAASRTLNASQILRSVVIVIGRPASICCQWRAENPKAIMASWT